MLQKTRVRDDPTRPDQDLRPGSWLLWHGKSLWCLRRRLLLQRQRGTIKSPVEEAGQSVKMSVSLNALIGGV